MFRRSRRGHRAIFAVVLAAAIGGCKTWKQVESPDARYFLSETPDAVRVTLNDCLPVAEPGPCENQFELRAPLFVRGDTLFGKKKEPYAGRLSLSERQELARQRDPALFAVPLADINRVEVRGIDGTMTAVGIAASVAAIVAIGAIADLAESDPPRPAPRPSPEPVSCPLVYSWNGAGWTLDSGTFGGAVFRPLARTDVDVLEQAHRKGGTLPLRMANELSEVEHVDAIEVVAVDARPGAIVVPDGQGRIHVLESPVAPRAALDARGRDVLPLVGERDGRMWESVVSGRDTARASDLRDYVELVFVRPNEARSARLLVEGHNSEWAALLMTEYIALRGDQVDAWYDEVNSDPEMAHRIGAKFAREAFLQVSVFTPEGWMEQGLVWEAGPEVLKSQAHSLDLSGVSGDTVRVRLASVPSFWRLDRVAADFGEAGDVATTPLRLVTAYDRSGRDVSSELRRIDGNELVMNTGDRVELGFEAADPVSSDRSRTYVLKSTGWYRILTPAFGEPDSALIRRIETEPGSIAKLSVARMNDLLSSLPDPGTLAEADR